MPARRRERCGEEDEDAADLLRRLTGLEELEHEMQEHEGHARKEQQRGQPAREPGQRNIAFGAILEVLPLEDETWTR